jgi:choline dehydrogenase-like flavoprotein
MNDLIIIGSGAAGAWAAYQAASRGLVPLVIDVGLKPAEEPPLARDFFTLRQQDVRQAEYLLGPEFESLHNIHKGYLSPRLKPPRLRFVTNRADELAPLTRMGFDPIQSFALGGLANAWGAGVYRYHEKDLKLFSLAPKDLDPYYETITREIGISGTADDLHDHFGSAEGLQQPLKIDSLAETFFRSYQKHRSYFQGNGLKVGRPRLAILSEDLKDRKACSYDHLSFWQPNLSYLYTPAVTVKELIRKNKIRYADQCLVLGFKEERNNIRIKVRNLAGHGCEDMTAKMVILAAGALNSGRIVLQSYKDYQTRLPLLENQTSLTPLLYPFFVGRPFDDVSHGLTQLNLLYSGPHWSSYVQGSFYSFNSCLSSDIFQDMPLAARGNLCGIKYLLPAISILQLFYQDEPKAENFLQLSTEGRLMTAYADKRHLGMVERHMIRLFRRACFISYPGLSQYPAPGNGIHYAGTLPMSTTQDRPYRTDLHGRLNGTRRVYVADASVFPVLPAKNHTFTVMANAMRIVDCLIRDMGAAG